MAQRSHGLAACDASALFTLSSCSTTATRAKPSNASARVMRSRSESESTEMARSTARANRTSARIEMATPPTRACATPSRVSLVVTSTSAPQLDVEIQTRVTKRRHDVRPDRYEDERSAHALGLALTRASDQLPIKNGM